MKPLQENYGFFELLCICPPAKSISRCRKLFNVFVSILCPFVEFILLIASFAYVKKYSLINLANAIGAFYQIAGFFTVFYLFIKAYSKRNDLKEIFYAFEVFYNACK